MFENRAHWADKAFWWVAPAVILASAGAGVFYYFYSRKSPDETQARTSAAPQVEQAATLGIQHPIPTSARAADAQPLPALNESDPPLIEALEQLFGDVAVKEMLVPEEIVRHVAVTTDNLPREKVAVERRPVKSVPGSTIVVTQGDLITLSEENFARYAPHMQVVRSMDTHAVADLYFRFYPLFQQAYEDLGYPGQYFNDRLVQAIDDLLATPEVKGPIALIQPRVFYEFADPKLEALSAGQKILLRIGSENASVVKSKLRELREAITRKPPAGEPTAGIVSPSHGGMRHWL